VSATKSLNERFGLAWLGALVLGVSTFVMLAYYVGWAQKLTYDAGREVKIEFASADQLEPGDPVRVDGIEEGRVTSIEDVGGGRRALVTVDVAEDAGPLYRDARAEVRWKHLLGGAFYVKIDRGTPKAGELGGNVIPRDQTQVQVEVEDLTGVFQGRAQEGLLTLIDELGVTLEDDDALAGLLETVGDAAPDLERGLRAARGLRPERDLRDLLKGTTHAMRALDAPQDGLRTLVEGAAATLSTTAGRDDDLRATLTDGPGVTALVQTTLRRLDHTLAGADGLVADLREVAPDVAPTLASLRPTLERTTKLVDRARPLVRTLRPTVTSLANLGTRGVPLLDDVQPSIDRLEKEILPYLNEPDPDTGKPTSSMIGGTAAGFGGSASQQDANGHFIRFPASVGLSSVNLPCTTSITDPYAGDLLACQSLDGWLASLLGYAPALDQLLTGAKGRKP